MGISITNSENMDSNFERREARAKEKLKQLKGFYGHLTAYLIVNIFIMGSKLISEVRQGDSFFESLFSVDTWFVPVAWGIGLGFHAAKTFGIGIFNKEWEQRQIEKYIEEDKREASKYR